MSGWHCLLGNNGSEPIQEVSVLCVDRCKRLHPLLHAQCVRSPDALPSMRTSIVRRKPVRCRCCDWLLFVQVWSWWWSIGRGEDHLGEKATVWASWPVGGLLLLLNQIVGCGSLVRIVSWGYLCTYTHFWVLLKKHKTSYILNGRG